MKHNNAQKHGNQRQGKRNGNVSVYGPEIRIIHSNFLSNVKVMNRKNVPNNTSIVKTPTDMPTDENPAKFGTINIAAYQAAARFMESPDNARPAAFLSFTVGRTRIPRTLAADVLIVNKIQEEHYG